MLISFLLYVFTAGGFSTGFLCGGLCATRRRENWLRDHQPLTAADINRMLSDASDPKNLRAQGAM